MGEILGSVICAGIFALIVSTIAIVNGRKRRKEMASDSYSDIATKWALWDHYVNAFDEKGLKKAKHMDWDTFYARPTEEKIQMLNDEFGPEQER
jgi:hypothetical protein